MSTPERQQDKGDYGYGAANQGSADTEDDSADQAQPVRPPDDPGEENPVDSPAADEPRPDTGPDEPETTTGREGEQPPEDQQTG